MRKAIYWTQSNSTKSAFPEIGEMIFVSVIIDDLRVTVVLLLSSFTPYIDWIKRQHLRNSDWGSGAKYWINGTVNVGCTKYFRLSLPFLLIIGSCKWYAQSIFSLENAEREGMRIRSIKRCPNVPTFFFFIAFFYKGREIFIGCKFLKGPTINNIHSFKICTQI